MHSITIFIVVNNNQEVSNQTLRCQMLSEINQYSVTKTFQSDTKSIKVNTELFITKKIAEETDITIYKVHEMKVVYAHPAACPLILSRKLLSRFILNLVVEVYTMGVKLGL
jgi:hypothetical protein